MTPHVEEERNAEHAPALRGRKTKGLKGTARVDRSYPAFFRPRRRLMKSPLRGGNPGALMKIIRGGRGEIWLLIADDKTKPGGSH